MGSNPWSCRTRRAFWWASRSACSSGLNRSVARCTGASWGRRWSRANPMRSARPAGPPGTGAAALDHAKAAGRRPTWLPPRSRGARSDRARGRGPRRARSRCRPSAPARLGGRAVERAASALDDAANRRAAGGAGLVLAIIDEEDVLAALLHVGDGLRAVLVRERRSQGLADGLGEPRGVLAGEGERRTLRVDLRAIQRLRDLDVPETRERALIHQRFFHRALRLREHPVEAIDVDPRERVRSERAQGGGGAQLFRGAAHEPPEQAHVAIVQRVTVVEDQRSADVGRGGLARLAADPLAGHAQVRDEPFTLVEREQHPLPEA